MPGSSRLKPLCGFLPESKVCCGVAGENPWRGACADISIPPSPGDLVESSRQQEIPRKIRMSKNLEFKIHETRDFGRPVTASTTITRFELSRKVRCHSGSVETELLARLIGAAGDLSRRRRDLGAAVLSDLFLRPKLTTGRSHKRRSSKIVMRSQSLSRDNGDSSRKARPFVFSRPTSPPLR
jgi:hypothetical protein